MKQFDIYYWQPPGYPEPHPSIILSHPARAANKPYVEVLVASTKRATRQAQAHEVILDQAGGLDWPTICPCDLIWAVHRLDLKQHKGRVAEPRQAHLLHTVIAAHGWPALL